MDTYNAVLTDRASHGPYFYSNTFVLYWVYDIEENINFYSKIISQNYRLYNFCIHNDIFHIDWCRRNKHATS